MSTVRAWWPRAENPLLVRVRSRELQPHCDLAADDDRCDRDEGDHQHPRRDPARRSGGGAGSPATWSRSRPLSPGRTRCPRCPALPGTTRCRHRQAAAAPGPRRARPAGRIRPQARPAAVPPASPVSAGGLMMSPFTGPVIWCQASAGSGGSQACPRWRRGWRRAG
jgi:hypothetical protein